MFISSCLPIRPIVWWIPGTMICSIAVASWRVSPTKVKCWLRFWSCCNEANTACEYKHHQQKCWFHFEFLVNFYNVFVKCFYDRNFLRLQCDLRRITVVIDTNNVKYRPLYIQFNKFRRNNCEFLCIQKQNGGKKPNRKAMCIIYAIGKVYSANKQEQVMVYLMQSYLYFSSYILCSYSNGI